MGRKPDPDPADGTKDAQGRYVPVPVRLTPEDERMLDDLANEYTTRTGHDSNRSAMIRHLIRAEHRRRFPPTRKTPPAE